MTNNAVPFAAVVPWESLEDEETRLFTRDHLTLLLNEPTPLRSEPLPWGQLVVVIATPTQLAPLPPPATQQSDGSALERTCRLLCCGSAALIAVGTLWVACSQW